MQCRPLVLSTLGSPMTSQVRSKPKCLDDLAFPDWSRTTVVSNVNKWNSMDPVWDTSKYHPKLSVSILRVNVIQGRKIKERLS